ncbi:hypothetical protein G6F31_019041 [Rhizopus arrhizus]|nr:hypothetical protein G6F31_019041 [Rhizopus arrhizus]
MDRLSAGYAAGPGVAAVLRRWAPMRGGGRGAFARHGLFVRAAGSGAGAGGRVVRHARPGGAHGAAADRAPGLCGDLGHALEPERAALAGTAFFGGGEENAGRGGATGAGRCAG